MLRRSLSRSEEAILYAAVDAAVTGRAKEPTLGDLAGLLTDPTDSMTAKVRKSAALTSDRDRSPPPTWPPPAPMRTDLAAGLALNAAKDIVTPAVAASIRQAIGELDDALHDIHIAALAPSGRVAPTRLTMEPSELCEPSTGRDPGRHRL